MARRVGGVLEFKLDGVVYPVLGNWTYGLGQPTREAIVGADGVHGYKETPTVPFFEGEATDTGDFSLEKLAKTTNATGTLSLANGKVVVLRDAWSANKDGFVGNTEDGKLSLRFEGMGAEEIR